MPDALTSPPVIRRAAVGATGVMIAGAVVTGLLAPRLDETQRPDDGVPPTLALELPRDATEAARLLGTPTSASRRAFERQTWADFGFIAGYGLAFALVAVAIHAAWSRLPRKAAPDRSDVAVATVARASVIAAIVGALLTAAADVRENGRLFAVLHASADAFPAAVQRLGDAATWKWGLLFATFVALGTLLWSASRHRLTAALLVAGAVVGGVGLSAGARPLVHVASLAGGVAVAVLGLSLAWRATTLGTPRTVPVVAGPWPASLLDGERDWLEAGGRMPSPDMVNPCPTGQRVPGASWAQNADRFGLALSGGGIRSATFNLGLLQALDALDLLPAFDYLATVSGGGYVGSFWTAWRKRRAQNGAVPGDVFPTAAHGEEAPPVRHLRKYSNFLSPRLGLLSYDTGRMLVAALGATLPALLATLSLLALAVGAWLLVSYGLLGIPERFADWQWHAGSAWSFTLFATMTGAILGIAERMWRERTEHTSGWYALAALVGGGAALVTWGALLMRGEPAPALYPPLVRLTPLLGDGDAPRAWLTLLAPAGAWVTGALALVAVRWTTSRWARLLGWREARAALDRVTSRLLFAAAAWTVVSVLWIAGAALWFWGAASADGGTGGGTRVTGLAGTTAALGALFRAVQKVLSKRPSAPLGGTTTKGRLLPKLPQLLAYLTVAGMVLTVVATILWLDANRAGALVLGVSPALARGFAGAIIVTLLTLVLFDPNEVGLHAFYRARLARAFLGASNPAGAGQTEDIASDDVPLHDLPRDRPLHLVCCAANDLASSDHLANLHRGSVSSVLSPVGYSVGTQAHKWPPPTTDPPLPPDDVVRREQKRVPTLASAMTASAAAFNSHMGSLSMKFGPAVTFLMTAFNLRLGLWLPHPMAFARDPHRRFPGLPFYRELFGLSRADAPSVLLSDGAHFENLAIYELVRRGCRYIIASDCGADPDVAFDDLGNLVRRAREDFGVEIDIDLAPLRPGADGLARQPMVAGDVHYPTGDTGVLLLFKPTLVGNEPVDVAQYKRRNDAFPHETTGDQFYDEAQWESYRRLGFHAGSAAFRIVVENVDANVDAVMTAAQIMESSAASGVDPRADFVRRATRVFARARMQWQPAPASLGTHLARLVDRATELDALLNASGAEQMLREVYKEVDEIDPAAEWSQRMTRTLPRAEDLAPSLHAIRRAILFMEEVYLTENLERNANHPLLLGIMNYFARWTYAPLFRMWWPLLKSLYARAFTSFVERHFGLEGVPNRRRTADAVLGTLEEGRGGFAAESWRLQQTPNAARAAADDDRTVISYTLCLPYGLEERYTVQAAQARMIVRGHAATWTVRDFFVPPGLWGIGIGEDFLDRLAQGQGAVFAPDGPLHDVRYLIVRVGGAVGAEHGTSARKLASDVTQLYRAAGFREAPLGPHGLQLDDTLRLTPADLPTDALDDGNAACRWFVAPVARRSAMGAA